MAWRLFANNTASFDGHTTKYWLTTNICQIKGIYHDIHYLLSFPCILKIVSLCVSYVYIVVTLCPLSKGVNPDFKFPQILFLLIFLIINHKYIIIFRSLLEITFNEVPLEFPFHPLWLPNNSLGQKRLQVWHYEGIL